MTRLLLGIVLGALGLALLVRFVASGARKPHAAWAAALDAVEEWQHDPYLWGLGLPR